MQKRVTGFFSFFHLIRSCVDTQNQCASLVWRLFRHLHLQQYVDRIRYIIIVKLYIHFAYHFNTEFFDIVLCYDLEN